MGVIVLALAPETVKCTLSLIVTAATPSAPLLPEVRLFKVPEVKLPAAYAVADSPVGEVRISVSDADVARPVVSISPVTLI